MKNNVFFKIYIGFSLLYLLIITLGLDNTAWFLKPFLIPILLIAVSITNRFHTKNLVLGALFFSWIGDVLLLFEPVAEMYFILGLLSFLIAHISYSFLFTKQKQEITPQNSISYQIGIVLILLYLVTILTLLFPTLKDLKIPVIVYGMVISIMLFFAFKGYFSWKSPQNKMILVGAIIFVASDSILAIDKFYEPIAKSTLWIMSTYLLAQYLICKGIITLNENKSNT